MEFAVSTMIFDHGDILEYLPLLIEEGIQSIELRGYPSRLDYRNKNYLDRLKSEIKKCGIKITSWHLPFHAEKGIDISLIDKAKSDYAMEEMKLSLEAMSYLGCKLAVVHPGDNIDNPVEKDGRYKRSRENIGKLLELCIKLNVKLAVENMLPGKVGAMVDDVLTLISGFDREHVGICFDTSHGNVSSNNNVAEELKKCGNRIFNVHISDNNGKKDEHALPFDGNIDWAKVLKGLHNLNYKGILTFEVVPHITDYRERLKEAKKRFERISLMSGV